MEEQREQFNDRLDILRHVSDIKLSLKKDITNDFVLARLDEKDKEFIIEMTGNAYFSKKLLDEIEDKGEVWQYSEEKGYVKVKLSEEERKKVKKISEAVFDSYMIKIYMTVVLNRNVDKNYLINVLSGYAEKEGEGIDPNEQVKGAVASLLADREKKEK